MRNDRRIPVVFDGPTQGQEINYFVDMKIRNMETNDCNLIFVNNMNSDSGPDYWYFNFNGPVILFNTESLKKLNIKISRSNGLLNDVYKFESIPQIQQTRFAYKAKVKGIYLKEQFVNSNIYLKQILDIKGPFFGSSMAIPIEYKPDVKFYQNLLPATNTNSTIQNFQDSDENLFSYTQTSAQYIISITNTNCLPKDNCRYGNHKAFISIFDTQKNTFIAKNLLLIYQKVVDLYTDFYKYESYVLIIFQVVNFAKGFHNQDSLYISKIDKFDSYNDPFVPVITLQRLD